jgi:hypothetical protein
VSRKNPVLLPDLDDEAFKARLRPLEHTIVPGAKGEVRDSQDRDPGDQNSLTTTSPDIRPFDLPDYRHSGTIEAAQRLEQLRQARGEKQRFEFVLPVRVGRALAEEARMSGMSATRKLLEILRDAGLPVLEEDLIDLRKEKRR